MLRAIMVYFFFFVYCDFIIVCYILRVTILNVRIKIGIFPVSLYGIRDVTSDYVRIFTYNISQFVVRILNVIEDKNLLLFYSLFSSKKM